MDAKNQEQIQYAIQDAAREVEYARDRLVLAMRGLAERMTRCANNLVQDPGFIVNSLGEVQGQGGEVDRMCALFAAKKEELVRMERLAARLA